MSKFKNIPNKVIVCGKQIKIEFVNPETLAEGGIGDSSWTLGEINLSENLDESAAEIVFMHEILHMIGYVTRFASTLNNLSELEKEEAIVQRIDHVLWQTLKENKLKFY